MKVALSSSTRRRGFTIIELIVTMAILSVILTLSLQVTESARKSVRLTESRSTNDAIARETFDRINRDLSQMVVREDARIEFNSKPGNDEFAFLTHAKGFNAGGQVGQRAVSLVSYTLQQDPVAGGKLLRGSRGHLYADTGNEALNLIPDLSFPAISPDNLHVLSSNVIRIEIEYLIQGNTGLVLGIIPPLTSENLRGLVITLVTLDDRGRRAIKPDAREDLAAKFLDAEPGTNTLKAWSDTRDDFAKSGIPGLPKDALQSVRCYQRTFLIP